MRQLECQPTSQDKLPTPKGSHRPYAPSSGNIMRHSIALAHGGAVHAVWSQLTAQMLAKSGPEPPYSGGSWEASMRSRSTGSHVSRPPRIRTWLRDFSGNIHDAAL